MELPIYLPAREEMPPSHAQTIPRHILQTFSTNTVHESIYNNVQSLLERNPEYSYIFVTDMCGVELIRAHFAEDVLHAFERLNIGAAKGDFLRYVALYVYGGVYLDLDSSIDFSLRSYIDPTREYIFFVDSGENIQQWCCMSSPKHPLILSIIQEMVKRIQKHESNIFLATGPTLCTDVIYNAIQHTNLYNVTRRVPRTLRGLAFTTHSFFQNGLLAKEPPGLSIRFQGYQESMLYNETNTKYEILQWYGPTPRFYKSTTG